MSRELEQMPSTNFKSNTAKNLVPTDKPTEYTASNFDSGYSGSLALRVSPNNKKTWFIRYRLIGKAGSQKFTLGFYPDMAYTEAKQIAATLLKDIYAGGNPKQQKQDTLEAVTVSGLFDIYYKHHALVNKKASSCKFDLDNYKKHIDPVIGELKADSVKRRDAIALLDGIAEHSPVMRNRIQSLLSVMFNVGVDREVVEHNPLFRLRKIKEVSRDRVLGDSEVSALWEQWGKVRMGDLFKLKLLTAQRDQEVKAMRWDAIVDGVWTIPKEITKNGKPHQVPLSRQAQEILNSIKHRGDYVFYAAKGKAGHVVSTSKCFRECRTAAGIPEDTRGHDLRRTAATRLGDLGVAESVIGKVLNHTDGSVTAIYNRSTGLQEKSTALQKWADKLDRILGKQVGNIVEFRRQSA